MMKLEFLGLEDSAREYLEEKGIKVTEVLPDFYTIEVFQVNYDVFEIGKKHKIKRAAIQVVTNDFVAYIMKDEFREVKIIL